MEHAAEFTNDIDKMTFWLEKCRDRDALKSEWLAKFPRPHSSMSARQMVHSSLDGGILMQCDLVIIMMD